LQFGIDNLASAKVLFDTNPRCYDSAGYLSHLGIELLLKALSLNETGGFPDEHRLTELHSRLNLPKSFPVLSDESMRFLARLNSFYALRYPRTTGPVSIGSEDWTKVEQAYSEILAMIPAELVQELDAKGPNQKGGRILMEKERHE
jgi:HEPN domain-containing protein